MSDIDPLIERGRNLLGEAFKRCEIPERSDDNYRLNFFGRNIYSEKTDNDIGIAFSYYHPGAGSMSCSISLRHLATQTARSFPEDEEAIEALVDALKYLESAVSALLPVTHHKLLRRMFNLKVRPKTDKEQQKAWIALLEQMTSAYSDSRAEMERKLAAERDWRGGSDARLKDGERRSLHTDYDDLYETAKVIKKDHDATSIRFAESHRRHSYLPEQWQEFWGKYANDLYEHDPAFLMLFASQDNPSASEVAYRHLAATKGHTRSYIERLVLESRKEAGKPKRREKPTIKDAD